MKRFPFIALLFGTVLSLPAQTFTSANKTDTKNNKNAPEIKFDVSVINFGIFDITDADKSCWFKFSNTGKEDLIIYQANATCGCTKVSVWPKDPIKPGGRDSIKVEYDGTTRRPGTFRKVIVVKTNAMTENAYIYIQGEMTDSAATKRINESIK